MYQAFIGGTLEGEVLATPEQKEYVVTEIEKFIPTQYPVASARG